jgi:hypothetical protein
MILDTHYKVSTSLLQEAISQIPNFERRLDLTKPTGDFFYDKWVVVDEFKNTVWERILETLPVNFGQARLMRLTPGEAYYSHADMDDRYHLNLIGERAYLVDLDNEKMYPTIPDGCWYLMDAGVRHSAVNFSNKDRIQLVIRNLLTHGTIKTPVKVQIRLITPQTNFRYVFDDIFSQWLNRYDKLGMIDNFKLVNEQLVCFTTDESLIRELQKMCPKNFEIKI